ncbi:YcaO-like family protein [Actinomadura roseirufa]|uniref:YcaO-like family protein n=1 Tax=Actinomadura roseirufa TaxID=2094049 RepID=UPI001041413C|nr:YcaO-like family protein [Actinomadura roseirufa]
MGRFIALAEAAERYAGCFTSGPQVLAKLGELDGRVLDMSAIPVCSPTEYARPECTLAPFDPAARIRWVQGTELTSAQPIWVPSVMACYGMPGVRDEENFWFRISTGYAVHSDPAEAIVRAICEVVERDAVALTWLQKLPLAPVPESCRTVNSDYLLDWCDRHFIRTHLFDATTDLGVPTVYCLQIAEHDAKAHQVIGCATERDLAQAAEKALLETVFVRSLCYTDKPLVESFADYTNVEDGARFMARPERAHAFDFLTEGIESRPVREMSTAGTLAADGDRALTQLIDLFEARGIDVIACDATSPELADVGLVAVSVVIPALQPMSLLRYAQYRAHPRLYQAPEAMGFRSLPEDELNQWPQPFP